MVPKKNKLDDHDDNGQDEHEKGRPVDPMHKPHRSRIGLVWIPLPEVEIFRYLPPYPHKGQIEY
jgi:hypothetical protein